MAKTLDMGGADLSMTALEKAINWALALDPELVEGLGEFADKRVAVNVEDIELRFCLRPGPQGVSVEPWGAKVSPRADVTISGSALTLVALAYRARHEADAPLPDDVRVGGDVALMQQLLEQLGRSRLDWEEWISQLTGDVAGHQVARGLRGLVEWSGAARRRLEGNVAEYLREEARLLPDRDQLASFGLEVERLRDDMERFEKRLRRLSGQAAGKRS